MQVRVPVGASVKLGYFAQHAMDVLSPEKTVWQTLVDSFPRTGEGALRGALPRPWRHGSAALPAHA